MKTAGIIAEYNPFHNGHLYHLDKTRENTGADFVVAVMSGNFVQRGEPAILDKWNRARMAVDCGVDLVLELPFAFACNNADYFAKGAVAILDGLGCVDFLSFGSETGRLKELVSLAQFLACEGEAFKSALLDYSGKGYSYPKARYEAVKQCLGQEAELIAEPNNILAVEYLKQLYLCKSRMVPTAVKREGTGYHDLDVCGQFASAGALRKKWRETKDFSSLKDFLPLESGDVFNSVNDEVKIELNELYPFIASAILKSDRTSLSQVFAAGEGVENRLLSEIRHARNAEELIDKVISKRYARTRISRLLMQLLLGLTKKDFSSILQAGSLYARILGFGPQGAVLLRTIKQAGCSRIPIITNINRDVPEAAGLQQLLKYDILASDLYNLAAGLNLYENCDQVKKPYVKASEKT